LAFPYTSRNHWRIRVNTSFSFGLGASPLRRYRSPARANFSSISTERGAPSLAPTKSRILSQWDLTFAAPFGSSAASATIRRKMWNISCGADVRSVVWKKSTTALPSGFQRVRARTLRGCCAVCTAVVIWFGGIPPVTRVASLTAASSLGNISFAARTACVPIASVAPVTSLVMVLASSPAACTVRASSGALRFISPVRAISLAKRIASGVALRTAASIAAPTLSLAISNTRPETSRASRETGSCVSNASAAFATARLMSTRVSGITLPVIGSVALTLPRRPLACATPRGTAYPSASSRRAASATDILFASAYDRTVSCLASGVSAGTPSITFPSVLIR